MKQFNIVLFSGNGASIARVDVSADGGRTWHVATLEPLVENILFLFLWVTR